MSLEMIGPASARGDKEFGKAYLERAMPLQKEDLRLIWGGRKAESYKRPKNIHNARETMRANQSGAYASGKPKSVLGHEVSRFNRPKAKAPTDPHPNHMYFNHRLTDPHHTWDFQWQGEGSRRGVSKIYRDQVHPPTKAVIRHIQGGGVNWRSSRPQQILATEALESHQRSALKAGIKPRFPRSKEKAAWNPRTKQYLNPENLRFGWHQTHAREVYDYQPGKRNVSKTFIPGAGKVTPDKGYQPAAIPATKLAAPARAERLEQLQQKQTMRMLRRTLNPAGRKRLSRMSMDRRGAIPLSDRGKQVNTGSESHAKIRELNQTRTTPSSTHKKVSYGPGITPERQKEIEAVLPKKVKRHVVFHHADRHNGLGGGTAGVTYARTGPTKASHVILASAAGPVHIRHEFEHSQPRRSFDRITRINRTPHGTGREEGRADVGAIRATGLKQRAETLYEQHSEMNRAAGRGNQVAEAAFRNTGGSTEFVRGYDEVRAKMGMKPRGARALPPSMHMAIRGEDAARAAAGAVRQVGVAGRRVRRLFGKADVEKKGGVSFALGRTVKPRGAGLSHPAAPFKSRLDYSVPSRAAASTDPRKQPLLGPKISGGQVTTGVDPYKLKQMKTIRAGRTARMRSRGEQPGLGGMGNFNLGKMFDWELGDIHAEQRLRERASGKPQQAFDRRGNELTYKPVKPKPRPEVPTAKPASGLRAIEAPKKMKAISAKMAPKPAANIRLVHSRPSQIGDMPRLKLPDYMRHLKVVKVDTTMSDADAKRLAGQYDTRGPLPKQLSREQRMKAYEARYIASGGKEGEKWQRRANAAEVSRNIGLAGATAGAALTLAGRHKRLAPHLKKVGITHHRADNAALGAAAYGGASELYGEHARAKRASFRNSPAGVAGSALSRMQAYTPEKKKP